MSTGTPSLPASLRLAKTPIYCDSSPISSRRKIALPFAIDPLGKLQAAVKADYALGQRVGIEHTPTIWVVTANSKGAPFVEVLDRSKLYQLIDQALEDTKGGTVARTAHQ
jgi:hypothetical protein